MSKQLLISTTFLMAACVACGPNSNDSAAILPVGNPIAAADVAKASLPVEQTTLAAIGLDPNALNTQVDPCDDIYEFACGGWLKNTEIPADKGAYGRFTEIYQRNETALHTILEEAKAGTLKSPVAAKIGGYYSSCMDQDTIEKAGIKPIAPLLKIAKSVKNIKSLDAAVAQLHRSAVPALFAFTSSPDLADVSQIIGNISQDGLGLPDPDYYLKKDDRSVALLKFYKNHVAAMFTLSGMPKAAAQRAATDVLRIETALAKTSMTRLDRRNPEKTYHKIDRVGAQKLTPTFDWKAYFSAVGLPDTEALNVNSPSYISSLESLRKTEKASAWRNYLTWKVVDSTADILSDSFADQNFKMAQKLTGATQRPERWKQCVAATNGALGELLAQPYLQRMFTPAAKANVHEMVRELSRSFANTIRNLSWMSDSTKEKALTKLGTVSPMFGYPDRWKRYEWAVSGNYTTNTLSSRSYEKNRDLQLIGKPQDRELWHMSPPTTNAYYDPTANQIVFPAGILQPPFYNENSHTPVNFGAIGMVIGHEFTHGFDDQGAKFDSEGNMKNWWADEDLATFNERGECVAKQYASYEPLKDLPLDGKLTLGENIADIGGVKLAYYAYRNVAANADKTLVADGYTEDQQFFIAVGQAWCSKYRDAISRARVKTDPHSPPRFRVIGALSNLSEFSDAFECKEGTPMNPKNSCSVW